MVVSILSFEPDVNRIPLVNNIIPTQQEAKKFYRASSTGPCKPAPLRFNENKKKVMDKRLVSPHELQACTACTPRSHCSIIISPASLFLHGEGFKLELRLVHRPFGRKQPFLIASDHRGGDTFFDMVSLCS